MIDIITTTYKETNELKCFINSIKSQTNDNWNLYIINDGLNNNKKQDLIDQGYLTKNIQFFEHPVTTNNYGHSLRSWALDNIVKSEYVLLTNADNYYVPIFVDEILKYNKDFIYFDLVHDHPTKNNHNQSSYGYMNSKLQRGCIDMGCVVVKSDIAKKVGFNHRDYAADWHYFNDILKTNPSIQKINKILMIHN